MTFIDNSGKKSNKIKVAIPPTPLRQRSFISIYLKSWLLF